MAWRADGLEHRQSLHTSEKPVATRLMRQKLMELGFEAKPTVASLLENLLEEYQLQGRKSSETTKTHTRPIIDKLGEREASAITTPILRSYAQERIKAGKSAATVNREFAALRRAMNLAKQDGLMATVPSFPMLKETGLRQGVYTREEFQRVYECLAPHLKPLAMFGYLTGRRRGELLQIRWSDVHLADRYIDIRASTTKGGQPDRLPISDELLAVLEGLETKVWLFEYRGQPIKHTQKGWREAAKRAGLPDKLFHDLRRSVATDLIEAGVSEQVAMAITGHRTRSVFARYNIVKSETVKNALSQLSDYRRER